MVSDARKRMIDSTSVLLAKRGLQGASFSAILEASGAPRGSLYHHFPGGKDELVVAAVESAGRRAMPLLDASSGSSAVEVATSFVAMWRAVLTRSDFAAGCAVAAVAVAADDDELLAHAGAVFREWRGRLAAALIAGGLSELRAPSAAVSLIAACEGAVILARAERSLEPFDVVAQMQIESIRALLDA